MPKVITFSTRFPSYHPKKGEPTYFVEKFLKGLPDGTWETKSDLVSELPLALDIWAKLQPKYHTIRAGKRWKTGDWCSPRVWGNDINPKSGRSGAYHSKQIILTSDIQIVKVYDIVVVVKDKHIFIDDVCFYDESYDSIISDLARNDGLTVKELEAWFNKPMEGQIIVWNNKVFY